MREIKLHIRLKAIDNVNGYHPGETVDIYNSVLDKRIGIAFYPIDTRFEVVFSRQFTGLKDKKGVEIYDGDIVKYTTEVQNYDDDDAVNPRHYRTPQYSDVTWVSQVEYKAPSFKIGFDCNWSKLEVIGNIYQNPDLLQG